MINLGIYKHYKGNFYQVLGLAKHTETLEDMVVYQALYGEYNIWTRSALMFLEEVLHEGKVVPRFQPITDQAEDQVEKNLDPETLKDEVF